MDPAKASALSRDVTTPLATLEELARSDLPFLRENVARHPHATPELLLSLVPSTLATEGERGVAMAVLSNPQTPDAGVLSVIRLLSRERVDGSRRENSPWERLAVAALGHPNVPAEAAENAVQSLALPTSLRIRLAERCRNRALLNYLLADRSEAVRNAAASSLGGGTEQIVGRERRGRVSDHDWCGDA